ncbi:flocculation protein FLO11-like isoform X2 [Neopelma chrysocephalum]|uniref:flocculation protein FLO11-like isoform X2 n=1 Tax=Neopelma chrysocephalum TaxID=114329 RepID=UPI000FCD16A6|nr:flocculation protein FLO11-like isoform X2 [Neopelma chrysocephalum]
MWKTKQFSNLQPRKWLSSWQRKHKVHDWQTQAAAQEEENSASAAAVAEQVRAAGPESQAAAPHSPRGRGRAVLGTLRRVARAARSGLAAGIRRRGRKPEPQREVEPGTEVATAGTSTAAGAERQDSALQSPCCPPSPFSSHPEALSGQWAGAAAGAVLAVAESEDEAWSEDESLWDISSLLELSTGDESSEGSWSTGQECSSVSLPCQAWAEPGNSQAGTTTVHGPGVSITSSYTRAKTPTPDGFPDRCALSPLPSDLEALSGQWAGTGAKAVLPVAPTEDGAWCEELSDICSLLELPQEEHSGGQSWRSREKRLPVPMPREAWSEPWDLQAPTPTARAPVRLCLSSPYIRPQAPTPDACPPSPSPSQLSALSGQWAALPDISRESRGEENAHQPLSQEEDSQDEELSEKEGEVIKIYTIWVKPSLIPVLLEPQPACREGPKCPCFICAEAAEEAVGDLHSTSPASAGPRHSQPTAAAPQRPTGCCPAVLDTLQRMARATLSRIAAVIRRRGRQPGEQRDLAQGMDPAMVATAPAAGAESQAAALHRPCCPPSPSPSQLEARGGQWAGAAAQTVLPLPQTEEGAWCEDESLWDISSLLERCQGQENTHQSWSTGGASSSGSLPSEAWSEPWDSSSGTSTSTSTD